MTVSKLSRADYRRQAKEKNTTYTLTKAQIDAIKRKSYEEVRAEFNGLDLKIRAEYEQQLNEKVRDSEERLRSQRITDINLVIAVSLHACFNAFGWKVGKNDRYQKYLTHLLMLLNSDDINLLKEQRWVLYNLGIELREGTDDST